ncbi:hypothetical protein [Actinomadura atramentaria]|uniref:hypothetical protein n=1 Tax=Actinomadura atramentaria TaxID=1990 RepID=UPI0003782ED5|nr:hypothetical protein [Actinomadura atramentaria]
MSTETHSGAECPRCHAHLALVIVPAERVAEGIPPSAPARPLIPVAAVVPQPREEYTPPPVAEVLAVYAGRKIDGATAARGAAQVRESLNAARAAVAQRRATRRAVRRPLKSA